MMIEVYRKKTFTQKLLRRLGALFLCAAGPDSMVILVPGTGYFVRNNKTLEVIKSHGTE